MEIMRKEVVSALAQAIGSALGSAGKAQPPGENEIAQLLETPPNPEMGDLAFPCFKLCAQMKCKPEDAARQIRQKLKLPKDIEKAEQAGAYLNFFFGKSALAEGVLEKVLSEKGHYGSTSGGKGKKTMVEYSSPNTNKPLHIGHLRNDALGMAISNVLENSGYDVIRANLINDRGIHICKSMLAYMKWGRGETPESARMKGDALVGKYYVMFSQEAEKNPKLEDEARSLLRQWEKGDKETRALWGKMSKWVLGGFRETYKEFGSRFDVWLMESDFYGKAEPIIEEGLKKGVFERHADGAIIAKLEKQGISDKTITRNDGTSLYVTNDLVVTKHKFEKFGLDSAYWVVGSEQQHYFRQLFMIFRLLGYEWAENCRHLSYGMVTLPEGKLKSREGKVVDADDLISDMKILAGKEVKARHTELGSKETGERSRKIALGAVKFFMLHSDASKEVLFEPKKAISFEGESGPYAMYSYARARSILRKAGTGVKGQNKGIFREKSPKKPDFSLLQAPGEKEVIALLGEFPEALQHVLHNLSPHTLCQYLLELSAKFNSFYHELPVLNADPALRDARLALVEAVCIVLKRGLNLLGIEELEEM